MKKLLLETSFSKIYMIVMIIVTLLILGGYFSYAMFTVTKEKSNAISIVTGNLTYKLLVDEEESNELVVDANSSKEFIVTLTNINEITARFNFYYKGDIPNGVDIGYIEDEGYNVTPIKEGINLTAKDTVGSENKYKVRLSNITNNKVTVELGVKVGLDYNDLSLNEDEHLLRKIITTGRVSEVLEDDIMNRLNYEDSEQTFITGSNPNNYIWYSGKLWRAVSIDPSDNSVKLVTQWNISAINYDDNSSAFEGSYMEMWLNDTSVDGFLYNLREPEKFIKMDSKWNASMMSDNSKPPSEEEGGTIVEDAVGLLNIYEYVMGGDNGGYLNNGLYWWCLTPVIDSTVSRVSAIDGSINGDNASGNRNGIRPSINLKPEIKIVNGEGTNDNPYRLEGDNDTNLEGTLLNTRYSGEYIRFGNDENNLYRIVSHETEGLTKITSSDVLKNKTIAFNSSNSNINYSSTNTIGAFLNGEYLTNYVGNDYINMIEENTTWYLGTVPIGSGYILAKYQDKTMNVLTTNITNASVGLLRYGELMSGKFNINNNNNMTYWLLTKSSSRVYRIVYDGGAGDTNATGNQAVKPSLNVKQNVIITGGTGLKNDPFTLELAN